MEFKSAHSNTTAKLPILKLGEYEMWVIRIKQYFQVQDYALWEVIENGNSWVSVPQIAQENGTSVTKMSVPVTTEEKTNNKNDVKARSLLLMALPDEHQLTFSQYNVCCYRNMIWRLQKIVSRLAILGVAISVSMSTRLGHFVRNVEHQKQKQGQFRYARQHRKQGNNEDTSSKAMLAIDGVGFDWSDMAEEQNEGSSLVKKFQFLNREEIAKNIEIKMWLKKQKRILDKREKGLGYNVVPPPHHLIYNAPTKLDLSYYGLDEVLLTVITIKRERMVSRNNYNRVDYDYYAKTSHPSAHRNMTPRAVLLKTSLTPLNTVRPVNTAHPKPAVHSGYNNVTFFSAQAVNTARSYTAPVNAVREKRGKPQQDDTGFIDSGCSRHMTGNIAYLSDFKEFDGGYVTFGGGAHGGRISGKGTLKTDSLDFEDVYFVNELKFNLFSVSQMCDKKNYILFTDTECLILSPNFKLPDESQILLKIPRKDNMYSFDMKNIVPKESLTCLVAKATSDESMLWHRRLGHINFKNINKLVKDNLVRGFPTKCFENDQTCVACLKGKQHRASCKSKVLNPITKPLFVLHMDLFGPTFVSSLMHKKYCLVVTDDYSRTPQQNSMADRKNRTLIEAARTMLANSKLPTTFWAKAVSTACYEHNRVLVVKPHNKTPYELFRGFKPALSFMRPFGCHVTILNTLDNLGKFDGKSDEVAAGTITNESASTQGELNAGTSTQKEEISQDCIVMPIWKDASYFDSPSKNVGNGKPKSAADDQKRVKDGPDNKNDEKDKYEDDSSPKEVNTAGQYVNTASPEVNTGHFKFNTVDPSVNTASSSDPASPKDMFTMGASHTLEPTYVEFFGDADEPEVDLGNILNSYTVLTIPNTRIHKDHLIKNVIGDVKSSIQIRRMTKPTSEQGFLSAVYKRYSHITLEDFVCMLVVFFNGGGRSGGKRDGGGGGGWGAGVMDVVRVCGWACGSELGADVGLGADRGLRGRCVGGRGGDVVSFVE
ncbi:putative ribonuclease H-like domain-containing protein [Tanacetum coccineum]